MKPKDEEQKLTAPQSTVSNARFQIEKLEERIAPSHTRGHYHGPGYNHGSGGHCGHGACK